MKKVAKFEKVSFEQFKKDFKDCFENFSDGHIESIYEQIKLPKRATKYSAGYDFKSPVDFVVSAQVSPPVVDMYGGRRNHARANRNFCVSLTQSNF